MPSRAPAARRVAGPLRRQRAGGRGPGVDIVVFLDRTISPTEHDAIEALLDEDSRVVGLEYYDVEQSLEEARRLFANNAAMLDLLAEEPDLVPASFRIVAAPDDPEAVRGLADELENQPGVLRVVTPQRPPG